MIDLSLVSSILMTDVMTLIHDLDGLVLEDLGGKEKEAVRSEKAQVSRDLLFLADRLAYTEQLVRVEYHSYKGESRP